MDRCELCRYYKSLYKLTDGCAGVCNRFPPTPVSSTYNKGKYLAGSKSTFPVVEHNMYCGEFDRDN